MPDSAPFEASTLRGSFGASPLSSRSASSNICEHLRAIASSIPWALLSLSFGPSPRAGSYYGLC